MEMSLSQVNQGLPPKYLEGGKYPSWQQTLMSYLEMENSKAIWFLLFPLVQFLSFQFCEPPSTIISPLTYK